MSKGKFKYKKIIFAFLLVSIMLFTFALPCSAEEYITEYYTLGSSTMCTAVVYRDSIDPQLLIIPYGDRYTYGTIEYSRFWASQMYQYTNGYAEFIQFTFNFSNLILTGYSNYYLLNDKFSISNQFAITNWPADYKITFIDSLGNRQLLTPTIAGNVAYINEYVKQEQSGNFSLEVYFEWEKALEQSTTARYINVSTIAISRPYEMSDLGATIIDSLDENTDKIINSNTEKNQQAQSNFESTEDSLLQSENTWVDEFNTYYNQLPDISLFDNEVGSVAVVSSIFIHLFDGLGVKFIRVWWVLAVAGLFSLLIGFVIKSRKG